jgi:hypothetical protein
LRTCIVLGVYISITPKYVSAYCVNIRFSVCSYWTESESYVTTDGQPASLSWNKASIWGLRSDLYYLCDSYSLVLVGRPL